MAPSEEDGSVEEKENNNKKRSKSAIATAWLTFYNITMTAGWLVLAVAMARFYIQKGNHRGLYKSISRTLKFFQTFALLEVVHCAVGIVRTSVIVTGVQVCSRIFMVWFVTNSIKQVISHSTWKLVIGSAYKLVGCAGQWQEASPSFLQTCWLMYTCVVYFIPTTFPIFPLSADCYRKIQNEESVVLFLVVWTVTEITRYSFYTFSLLNHLPYFIKWARYNMFIVMYPLGVAGELMTIYTALPYVRKSGMFSMRLPNKYNVSFDYYIFLIIIMLSYIPLFPQLYFHMLRQRRKVLHGEVIVEKDD